MVSTPGRAIVGKHCMVSSGHPLATLAGVEVLRAGGNAVDAAVAAGAVSCVVLPHACGVGGDLFAIGYDASQRQLWAINGSGRAPALATLDLFRHGIPEDEITSTTVPGAVHAWSELVARYGHRQLGELLHWAINWAHEGFVVDAALSTFISANERKLRKHAEPARVFMPDGRLLKQGDYLRQVSLASTLKRIAVKGAEDFYSGDIARRVSSHAESVGGLLRTSDLSAHASRWENPIGRKYYGYDVFVPPPNSIGILLLVQLALLNPDELKALAHNSAQYIEKMLRAKRTAFAQVLPLLTDPDSLPIPAAQMVSEDFLSHLRNTGRAGVLAREVSDTTAIITADDQGNVVSLIQSVYFHFGCGVVAGDTGILLNNRMMGFSTEASHPNVVAGNKRPAHTLAPALVLRDRQPVLGIATPGAFAQTQSLCQLLNNVLVFGFELQQALEAPRWFDDVDNTTLIESRIPLEVVATLSSSGHKINVGGPWEPDTGNAQAVQIDDRPAGRIIYGAADLRRNGCALGW